MKFPKSLGACVDAVYKMREARLKVEKSVEEMKAQEGALKDHIINSFKKDEIDGAKGKSASASINQSTVAQVNDWEQFYSYIAKEKAFDLLQRRVNDGAYRARLDEKLTVPGVEPFVVTKLSVTKVGSK